ncbi:MAG TPA: MarR family transcriptional regulator [Microbacterium sp.]|nr:MarR family transcriptional regulator [Microbacterium sp.]
MSKDRVPSDQRVALHAPLLNDPEEELVRRSHLRPAELESIVRVLDAMGAWREVERRMSEASQRYMKLGETDMRALRLLIAARRQHVPVTPGAIASHLGISTASTTKLLDRLERGGHIHRRPHPRDRRSLTIEISDETRAAARDSVGRSHARRFEVVADLTAEEREVVAAFFEALAATEEAAESAL